MLFLSAYKLFANHVTIRYSDHNLFVSTTQRQSSNPQLHTRLTELQMPVVRFVWPFYIRTTSACRTFSKQNGCVLAFSRTLFRPLVYVLSHTCPRAFCCWFIWKVFDIFVTSQLVSKKKRHNSKQRKLNFTLLIQQNSVFLIMNLKNLDLLRSWFPNIEAT